MSAGARSVCKQCGAEFGEATACRRCFEALLAFEAERPAVFGAVHHLTVATYSLQHPAGYGDAALAAWRAMLADTLDGRATVDDLRRRVGRTFSGSTRVVEAGATVPTGWPSVWPVTVQGVLTPTGVVPTEAEYIARAREWAATTRAALDASQILAARPEET